ncbi:MULTISPECIES: carbohydrate ABC transporter permease [Bacillus]|uniref:Multiple sugar transport system permease protein n=1 Tax=Bacillus capparidis TaxID=1840411 RepID=A0ABS4CZL0_9BACI|nr:MULTISPECIES: sugar ABC transporter permease [Bacillus]MBP1082804.1 multiple sugar transport system permease protein [Bacillus capparidis]MED1098447.1 sugar ABC transporter permease [Bacillus capparidis]
MEANRTLKSNMKPSKSQQFFKLSYRQRERLAGLGFIFPVLVLLIIFMFYPMIQAFIISFQEYNLISLEKSFIGNGNYLNLMKDQVFLDSLLHSLHFAVIVVPVQGAISLGIALLIQKKSKVNGIFRTIYFIPVVISTAVAATVFKLIYNKEFGLLNNFLESLHLPTVNFLSDPNTAMYGVIILGVWKSAGFFMIVFLAGLNSIPFDLYEAARVDGAGRIKQFFYITLPLLKRTIAFVAIITTIDAIKLSALVYVLTDGGPSGATETTVVYIFRTAFEQMNMGYASAAAFILFAIVLIISLIQMRLFKSDVEY